MTYVRSGIMCIAALVLLMFAGCRRAPLSPEQQAAADAALRSEIRQSLITAEGILSNGQTNEALKVSQAILDNPRFVTYRPQIFEQILRMSLRWGNEAFVRQQALQECGNASLADIGCGLLYRTYRERNELTKAVEWSETLLSHTNLVPGLRKTVLAWEIDDTISLGSDDRALAILFKAVHMLSPQESVPLIAQTIDTLLNCGHPESVERAISVANTIERKPESLTHLLTVTRMRLYAHLGEWDALTNSFSAAASTLPDDDLNKMLNSIFALAQKAGRGQVISTCSEMVLFSPSMRVDTNALTTAIYAWTEQIMRFNKNALPSKLNTLLHANLPVALVASTYVRHYYAFAHDPAEIKELMAIGERMIPMVPEEDTRNDLKLKLLDGCFLIQDYDHALAILEAGVPGHNEQWQKTAIVKVKAHRALANKNPREAVQYFRAFMEDIRKSNDTEIADPVTGIFFAREMVLGRNARRIGDILNGIPDHAEARKAYAEARDLYEQALGKTKDAKARKIIEDEITLLPRK